MEFEPHEEATPSILGDKYWDKSNIITRIKGSQE